MEDAAGVTTRVWTFVLAEQGGSTRLISRNRFRASTREVRAGMLPMQPASLVMERKMSKGIKQRAERMPAASGAHQEWLERHHDC
jgi:hypothetical protein